MSKSNRKQIAKDYSIESFKGWRTIADYESDYTSVTLLDKNRKRVATFSYPRFTREDFERLKNSKQTKTKK